VYIIYRAAELVSISLKILYNAQGGIIPELSQEENANFLEMAHGK